MLIQAQAGGLPSTRQTSGNPTVPAGSMGELLGSRMLPEYYTLLKAGMVFNLATLAANATGFVGAAAGTPLLALFNPLNSGKDLVLLEAVVGLRTTGTGAAANSFNHFAAAQGSTAITGTVTGPRNQLTQALGGSVASGLVNTANTGAIAASLIRPSISIGNATATGGVNVGLLRDEIRGEILIPPGGYYAFGLAATLTAGSIDAAIMWAEVPA